MATLLDADVEDVYLRLLAGVVDERDEHLRLFAALLPEVVPYGRKADLVALLDELPMDPGAGDALFWGGAIPPL